jgi:hypothetical protein
MSDELMRRVALASYHQTEGIKTFAAHALDLSFFEGLRQECLALMENESGSNVTYGKHVTNWTNPYGTAKQYSLWNTSGDFSDTSTDHNNRATGKSFHHAQKYPLLDEFIRSVPEPSNFRLNWMGPQSGLSPHEENVVFWKGGGLKVKVRFHLPIVTNPNVRMLLDWDNYRFLPGTIYYFNNGCVHAASNSDPEHGRMHLVWDMWVRQSTLDWLENDTSHYNSLHQQEVEPVNTIAPTEYAVEGKRFATLEDVQTKNMLLV